MPINSGVVAPKLAISRPLPSKVGAHTQWRSLPRSIPATFRRITGKPSSCRRLFSQVSISSLPGICFLSEHARPGWPIMDSGLGESYGSLANVQLPSRNHALLRGIRSNGNRVIAAVALSCTIPSASSESQIIQSGQPVAKLFSDRRAYSE
jgi:hypothetical protein